MDETKTPRRGAVLQVIGLITVMWALEAVDTVIGGDLDQLGIVARTVEGLRGVVLSPLLHADFAHLAANTVPLLVLGAVVALEGKRAYWKVTGGVGSLGGLGTWLISPADTLVVGASGVVFGYLTYLVARGAVSRRPSHVVLSLLVAGVYGSLILGVLPSTPGVSWQAHLAGAVAGVVVALALHRRSSSAPGRA